MTFILPIAHSRKAYGWVQPKAKPVRFSANGAIESFVLDPNDHPYPQLVRTMQTSWKNLMNASQVYHQTNGKTYHPKLFFDRPTTNTRNRILNSEIIKPEEVRNSEIRNFGKLAKLPDVKQIQKLMFCNGFQERFNSGGMGVFHALYRHGPDLFPVLNGNDQDSADLGYYSRFTQPDGQPLTQNDMAMLTTFISETLTHGKLLRVGKGSDSQVYYDVKNHWDKPDKRYYTFILEHSFSDGRATGVDVKTGKPLNKVHVVLLVYPESDTAYFYTAYPRVKALPVSGASLMALKPARKPLPTLKEVYNPS